MLLMDLEDYTVSQWYGTGNIEVNCDTWEDGYTTARATRDAYLKAFNELILSSPIQISEADVSIKDDLKTITDEIWANWKIYLEKETALWYSFVCRCGDLENLIQDEQKQEEHRVLCKSTTASEIELVEVKESISKTENNPNLTPEEKAKILAELLKQEADLEAEILNNISLLNAILEEAITKITFQFRHVDWQFIDFGVDGDVHEVGKWWVLRDATTTWDLDLNSIGEGAIIEDGKLKFQEIYWNEYEQSIKNVNFSIKKWFAKVWGLKIGEADFTPAPPINGFSNPVYVPGEIPAFNRDNFA
jgi:hypothetical protein